ncbi:hypothetical protein AB0368_06800 [Actinoplanes sp. NPDC051475]|uniref:hypothetical protein n=1 Tax=Actinoplanes sp. NPDC051475 TaxID=3157225 RepID=UPI00344FE069
MRRHKHTFTSPSTTTGSGDPLRSRLTVDVVPGEPPVPISLWRTARTGQDRPDVIGARLAEHIVAFYSQPGEAVIDLTAGHGLTQACAVGYRLHHQAWFTDAALTVAPATENPPADTPPAGAGIPAVNDGTSDGDGMSDGDDDAVDPADWFGNDLTDTDLPGGDTAGAAPHAGVRAGRVSLIVATWPLSHDDGAAGNRVRLAFLLAAARRLLRPRGCLVLVIADADDTLAAAGDFTPMVNAAAVAGLDYQQHIVAITADTDRDEFRYHAAPEEITALIEAQQAVPWRLHVRVHNDLLVFLSRSNPTSDGASGAAAGTETARGEARV